VANNAGVRPKQHKPGEYQGPDAYDVDPFIDGVVVVSRIEGELWA
jgi:hypothetical protein